MNSQADELSNARIEEIEGLAEFIADDHFPDQKIEPENLLQRKGITFNYGYYGTAFDGLIEYKERSFHVYCNLDRVEHPGSGRARHTLSHELGHYFIDSHRNALRSEGIPFHPSKCNFESDALIEREADLFASSLLMPERRFLASAESKADGMKGIIELADQFGTSLTSTAIRYIKMDVIPCAVIKWHSDSYGWCWISNGMYEIGVGRVLKDIDEVPHDSATALALQGEDPEGKRYHESGGTVSFWFPSQYKRSDDPLLLEEAVSLGEFGALTLLQPYSP